MTTQTRGAIGKNRSALLSCPKCQAPATRARRTESTFSGRVLRRIRLCPVCGHKFNTYEAECLLWPTAAQALAEGADE